jgi:hypothetical protein
MHNEHRIAEASLNGAQNHTANDTRGFTSFRRKGDKRQPPMPKRKNLANYSLSASPLALISASLEHVN